MTYPVLTPRVNNNDDQVRFSNLLLQPGDAVRAGQEIAEVETDKANFAVEAERNGYLVGVIPSVGDTIDVGSVLLWIADSPHEQPPNTGGAGSADRESSLEKRLEPTAKAKSMIGEMGLDAAHIASSGERITVADVEAFLAKRKAPPLPNAPPAKSDPGPSEAGTIEPLTMDERGMLRSVLWHRDVAVPAYLEISYDQGAWNDYAESYARRNRLMGNPLVPLMAYWLVKIAQTHPKLNCVVAGEQLHRYHQVNLGLTIQTDQILYLAVIRDAEKMEAEQFIKSVNKLHKGALTRKLTSQELSGATIGFSSMSRWSASRHIPILPPHVSFMVAQTVSKSGEGVLGTTYDHRLLSGGDAIAALTELSALPPDAKDSLNEPRSSER